jgi:hypothetical protein
MRKFLNEHGWYISMIPGISLLATATITGVEFFTGQVVLAAVLIIFSLVVEGATKDNKK